MAILTAILLGISCSTGSGSASDRTANRSKPNSDTTIVREGDLASRNGTATVRKKHTVRIDDPETSNDESNDQPLGHYGTITLDVRNVSSGHSYSVDADVDEDEFGELRLRRLYFVKGGWVDFVGCGLESDYSGSCSDENGRDWEIEGRS